MHHTNKDHGDSSRSATQVRPTRKMLRQLTNEIAAKHGRLPHEIKQIDYESAKRELTGETDFDRQQAVLDGHP